MVMNGSVEESVCNVCPIRISASVSGRTTKLVTMSIERSGHDTTLMADSRPLSAIF